MQYGIIFRMDNKIEKWPRQLRNICRKGVGVWSALLMLLLQPGAVRAQDERYFRSIFSGEISQKDHEKVVPDYKWVASSSMLRFDFNGDYFPEYFQVSKRDGEDWVIIRDYKKRILLEQKLTKSGAYSWPYKLTVAYLKPKLRLIVIHFFEGASKSINFVGTTRLYFITIDDKLSDKYYFAEGPSIWDEREGFLDHYHQRSYKLLIKDFNHDGQRDVAVTFHDTTHMYFYLGQGDWKEL